MPKRPAPAAWVLSALIVGTVAVDPFGFAPFGPIKWLLVTACAFGALWLGIAAKLQVHRSSLWGWITFLIWGAVVSLPALDPVHTWIGTPDRRLGLVTVGGFAAAYWAAQSLRQHDVGLFSRGFAVALWVSVVAAALEAAVLVRGPFDFPGPRIGGPFGTPAYLGAALVLFIPIGIATAPTLPTRAWQMAARIASGAGGIVLLATQTRGALVGAVAAAAFTFPAWSRWARVNRLALLAAGGTTLLILTVTSIGPRLVDAANFDDGAAAGRLAEWTAGLDAIASSPLVGTGFEGYRVAFPTVVSVEYVQSYGRTFATDRAHNGLIDVTIWTGLIGGIFYLVAFGFLFRRAWQAVRRGNVWLAGFAGAVVGYLIQQQFLFPVAEIDGAFWAAAGVLVAHTQPTSASRQFPLSTRFVALLMAAAVATFGVTDVLADHDAKQGSIEDLARFESAVRLRPDSIRYRLLAANANVDADIGRALDHLVRARTISPGDPILAIREAELLSDRATATGRQFDAEDAVRAWRDLAISDPNHPTVQLALGVAEVTVGNEPEAEAAWKKAELLAPDSPEPAHNLAILFRSQGRDEEAAAAEARAKALEENRI